MIIVELSGGFGNQLFQYAAGLSLAKHHGVELRVDISRLNKPDTITGTTRNADIFNLAILPLEATLHDVETIVNQQLLSSTLDMFKPLHKRRIYKERSTRFDKNFFKAPTPLYLKGNRQSEKYFRPYQSFVREHLQLSRSIIARVEGYGLSMQEVESVSIHIRRGDYLTPVAMDWLGVLPLSYYHDAINRIATAHPNSKFYVFSDDITWVKNNLSIQHPVVFASGTISNSALEDFYLMSCCKHNIIANSTFSWWAGWMNNNPEKMVICPAKWYNKTALNTSDLYPKGWIRL